MIPASTPVGRDGTVLSTSVEDTGATVLVSTPFGAMSLKRWQDANDLPVDAFLNGVVDGAGLRDQSYNSTERNAAAEQSAKANSNIAIIAIMLIAGFGLAHALNGGN